MTITVYAKGLTVEVFDKAVNQPPQVAASASPTSVNEGSAVTLQCTATDSDGTVVSYQWAQTSGPTVSLTGAASANASFTAPQVTADTTLGFTVTVTDNSGAVATASVSVLVKDVPVQITGPILFYQDFLSAPVGGYMSFFGSNLANAVSVKIGSVVQQIVYNTSTRVDVKIATGTVTGSVVVRVGTLDSISNLSATIRPGTVKLVALNGGAHAAVNAASPGDQIILRGGTWTEGNSNYGSFFTLNGKSGTATDPIMVRNYPGETVLINRAGAQRGIHIWDSAGGLAVASLKVDMQGGDTAFGWPPGAASSFGNTMQNIRAVDNEFTGQVGPGGGSAAMEGRGKHIKYIGNRIHDNRGDKLYHSIYFDNNDGTGVDDVEIAYNHCWNQGGGRGIQIYNAGTTGIKNVNVHHNLVHDIALDGILFGDSCTTGMQSSYNTVYRCAVASLQADGVGGGCMRFNNVNLVAVVFNNTFVDGNIDGDPDSGNIRFQAAKSVQLNNNIVVGNKYLAVDGSLPVLTGSSGNVWFGAGNGPTWDTSPVNVDPQFVDRVNYDLHLKSSSPVVGKGAL